MNKRMAAIIILVIITPTVSCPMRGTRLNRVRHNQVPLCRKYRSFTHHPPVEIPFISHERISVTVPTSIAQPTRVRIEQMSDERKMMLVEQNKRMFDSACKGKINVMANWFKNSDAIERSLVINQIDQDGRSLLIKAAQIAHLNFMGLLLALDAYAVISDKECITALNANARKLTPYLVERLLEKGSYVDAQDSNGNTALHQLALKYDPKSMEQWSPAGENLSLCQSYHRKSVEHLLVYGANFDLNNDFGETPYKIAQDTQNVKILRMFDAQRKVRDKSA